MRFSAANWRCPAEPHDRLRPIRKRNAQNLGTARGLPLERSKTPISSCSARGPSRRGAPSNRVPKGGGVPTSLFMWPG
jgi:hypothetical protein